jgi:chemotaxis protein MotA
MEIGQYFDPSALALVGLGCVLIAAIQNGARGLAIGLASLGHLFRRRGEGEGARLATLIVEDIVRRRGIGCADRGPKSSTFTHDIGELMSNATGYDALVRAVARLLADHEARRARAVQVWNDIADAAPALGMLGTVVGLVQIFARMDSVAGVGEAMALCLLTSLYGLVFAHLIAGPIARRLALLGAQDAAWQDDIGERLLKVARDEYPGATETKPRDAVVYVLPHAHKARAR